MKTNKALLQRIDAAIKAITVGDLGAGILQTEKADRFLRVVQDSTPVLDAARFYPMNAPTRDIDRIGFGQRILTDPATAEADPVGSVPTVNTNQLVSVEVMGTVGIRDDTLEDNIEQEAFEDTLLDLVAERTGQDLEELFLAGQVGSGDTFLNLLNGWIQQLPAGQQLDGGTADFDAADVEAMLEAMLLQVPPRYRRDRAAMRYYVSDLVENDYRNVLRARGTNLGDQVQTGAQQVAYKGIPLQYSAGVETANHSAVLWHPQNTVYGMWRTIRIEPDRLPRQRQTDFIITARVAATWEDENGGVAAVGYTG